MAVSGKTEKLEVPYFLGTDKPPDIAAGTKGIADKIESTFAGSSGQLLIVQSTGAPAAKAMKGDATLAADGTLTVGAGAISNTKIANGTIAENKLAKPRVVGAVDSSGAIKAGEGFTVEHLGAGEFKVTLTEEQSSLLVVNLTIRTEVGARGIATLKEAPTKKTFVVWTANLSNELTNIGFNFMARAA